MAQLQTRPVVAGAWDDFRARPQACSETRAGHSARWIEYPDISNGSFSARCIGLPAGGALPLATLASSVVLVCVEGRAEVIVDGAAHELGPQGLLGVEQGASVSVRNTGDKPCVFCRCSVAPGSLLPSTPDRPAVHLSADTSRQQTSWALFMADQWGFVRGSGPYVAPAGMRGHLARMPYGQSSPWHSAPRDLFFVALAGEVEFRVGDQHWRLKKLDMLMVPQGAPYQYLNIALEESVFLSIGPAVLAGAKSHYFSGNPGWPVTDPDMALQSATNPYADLR